MPSNLVNGDLGVATKTTQLSFPLPLAPQTRVHIHLTIYTTSLLLFLTTSSPESNPTAPLGSFVYAMPNRSGSSTLPASTALYPQSGTVDFATRLAQTLARKTNKPSYIGCSINLSGLGMGGSVEEEMAGLRKIVDIVVTEAGNT